MYARSRVCKQCIEAKEEKAEVCHKRKLEEARAFTADRDHGNVSRHFFSDRSVSLFFSRVGCVFFVFNFMSFSFSQDMTLWYVVWCGAVRCAVPCCAVLCCAVLCGAVRCGAVCCAVLCCAVLCCAVAAVGGRRVGVAFCAPTQQESPWIDTRLVSEETTTAGCLR